MGNCITEPVHKECCIFNNSICFECVGAFTDGDHYLNDILLGHVITAIFLILISIWNIILCIQSYKKPISNRTFSGYITSPSFIANKQQYQQAPNEQDDDEENGQETHLELMPQITNNNSDNEEAQNPEIDDRYSAPNKSSEVTKVIKTYIPWMRINNAAFAFLTALFALARAYFELGKPLAIAGATHNLCEWGFITFVIYKNKKQREYGFFISLIWILLVITLVMIIATFPAYLLIEQISGIAMDVLLPIIWGLMLYQNYKIENKSNKKAYNFIFIYPFIAHLLHLLFTIIPLVILNFIQNQNEFSSRMLESFIYISAPITHILYTKFTTLHQKYIDIPSYFEKSGLREYPHNLILNIPKFIKHPTVRIGFWYIIAIIIGSLPTAIIPLIIRESNGGYCHNHEMNNNNHINMSQNINVSFLCDNYSNYDSQFVIGTAIANINPGMSKAFEYFLNDKKLVEIARNYEGNVFYYFTKNIYQENSYLFVEGWTNIDFALKWINSPEVDTVFNNYTYQMLVDGALEINGYQPLETFCGNNSNSEYVEHGANMGLGAIRNVFTSWNGCEDLWRDMSNFSNCDWIYHRDGCNHIEIIDEKKGERAFIMGDGTTIIHNTVYYANKRVINENLIYYNYSLFVKEFDRYPTISLIYDANDYGKDSCVGIFGFETNIKIATIDEIYGFFSTQNIPYLQNKYEAISPKVLGIPDNFVSRTLLKIETALDFILNIQSFQANATTYSMYHEIAPYLYSPNGQIIFNHAVFNGFDEIKQLYDSSLGASLSVYHSFLMDPIVEKIGNETMITMISSLYQESFHKSSEGCDYSYPMMISVSLTNTFPIEIKKLVYNTPKYSYIEQVQVLTNCDYLSVKERNNLTTDVAFQEQLRDIWGGFRIINEGSNETLAGLWAPYLANNVSVLFNGTEFDGIEQVTRFYNDLEERIFGGYRFDIVSLIANDGFVTIHLRGSIASNDLRINYNDDFRMSIEYRLNQKQEISLIIYHIDTEQLEEIDEKFDN